MPSVLYLSLQYRSALVVSSWSAVTFHIRQLPFSIERIINQPFCGTLLIKDILSLLIKTAHLLTLQTHLASEVVFFQMRIKFNEVSVKPLVKSLFEAVLY